LGKLLNDNDSNNVKKSPMVGCIQQRIVELEEFATKNESGNHVGIYIT
jgi:hypothetical protein